MQGRFLTFFQHPESAQFEPVIQKAIHDLHKHKAHLKPFSGNHHDAHEYRGITEIINQIDAILAILEGKKFVKESVHQAMSNAVYFDGMIFKDITYPTVAAVQMAVKMRLYEESHPTAKM